MFKLTQPVQEFMEGLNDVLNDWEDLDYKPNDVRQVEEMLDRFYDQNSIDVSDTGRFNTDINYSEEQIAELYDIADFAKNQEIYLEDLESKFKKAKGKHGISTLEDYASFIDKKTRFENSVISSSKISYYEYEALQRKASKDKRRTVEGTDKRIENAFLKKGLTGSDLYDFVYKQLSKGKK